MANLNEIKILLEQIQADIRNAAQQARISPQQMVIVEGLSDISKRLGLIQAGEFRAGNGKDPGDGFTGVRIGYPAFVYENSNWHIAGVSLDVLQIGINADNGKLYAAGGNVVIDATAIKIGLDSMGLRWSADPTINYGALGAIDYVTNVYGANGALSLEGQGLADSVRIRAGTDSGGKRPTLHILGKSASYAAGNSTVGHVFLREDPVQDERTQLAIQSGDEGARLEMYGASGGSIDSLIDFRTAGATVGATFMRMRETSSTPPLPGSDSDAFHLYMKDDKLIIQFNDGGTLRYKYLPLTGTDITWVHTTTAP